MIEAKTVSSPRRLSVRPTHAAEPILETGSTGQAASVAPSLGARDLCLSFVVPVKDEEATLEVLYSRIAEECSGWSTFEVIFIDDGSRDNSWEVIQGLAKRYPGQVRGLRFRRNCGKAAALTAGFRAAKGSVVFTMDADLQDDPAEIRRFLEKLEEGYDLVSGYKRVRHDPWHKVLPSRVFNAMLSKASGVKLHDHNCGFKCYRSDVTSRMTLYGEMHRMVPSLASIKGFRSAEIVVQHHPRKHGVSKYGIERFLRGFMDMITVGFLRRYRERPSHFFGGVAACSAAVGFSLITSGLLAATFTASGLAAATATICGTIMTGTAILAVLGGILAELIVRGGLNTDWKLPITEDTRFADKDPSRLTDIPTSYSPSN